jgi:hypothetical protein
MRVFSGMRPTGKLHLGHLEGVLNNYLKLQEKYECYFMIADYHRCRVQGNPIRCRSDSGEELDPFSLLYIFSPLFFKNRMLFDIMQESI